MTTKRSETPEPAVPRPPTFSRKDLLDIESITEDDIRLVLDTAESMREINQRSIKKVPTLRGKLVANLFFENSTRTRFSFEIAERRLSADSIALSATGTSVAKGETLLDTGKNLMAMAPDAIVIRHQRAGAPHLLARHLPCAVVNAGDGAHAHPTQALLDAFTIRRAKGSLAGLRVAICGDVSHSRVARSDVSLLTKMGAGVTLFGPATLLPVEIERTGARVVTRIEEAVEGADVVMILRVQKERGGGLGFPSDKEYFDIVRPDARTAAPREEGRDRDAPGPDEPRRRDRLRRRGRAGLRDPRPGRERRRGAHGRAVPPDRSERR